MPAAVYNEGVCLVSRLCGRRHHRGGIYPPLLTWAPAPRSQIFESRKVKLRKLDVDIPLTSIDRITLSPWVYDDLSDHIKRVLWSIQDCRDLKIVRSTLISNEEWKELFSQTTRSSWSRAPAPVSVVSVKRAQALGSVLLLCGPRHCGSFSSKCFADHI